MPITQHKAQTSTISDISSLALTPPHNLELNLTNSTIQYFYPEVINGTYYDSENEIFGSRDAIGTAIYMFHPILIMAPISIALTAMRNLCSKDQTPYLPSALKTAGYSVLFFDLALPLSFAAYEFITSPKSYTDAAYDVVRFGANIIDSVHLGIEWSAKEISATFQGNNSAQAEITPAKAEVKLKHPEDFCTFARFQKFTHIFGVYVGSDMVNYIKDALTHDCTELSSACLVDRLQNFANKVVMSPKAIYDYTATALEYNCTTVGNIQLTSSDHSHNEL